MYLGWIPGMFVLSGVLSLASSLVLCMTVFLVLDTPSSFAYVFAPSLQYLSFRYTDSYMLLSREEY